MVKVRKDLTGMKFNHLLVIRQAEDYVSSKGLHYAQWWVICDCGESDKFTVRYGHLTSGNTKSCGCLATEARIKTGQSKKKNIMNMI